MNQENADGYQCWRSMLRRCYDKNFTSYDRYGGVGIRVYAPWRRRGGFKRFMRHIGERPSKWYSIDRIDNRGSYVPGNVRWATPTQQSSNRNNAVLVVFKGKRMSLTEVARAVGIKPTTLHQRVVRMRWSLQRAVTVPVRAIRARRIATGKTRA